MKDIQSIKIYTEKRGILFSSYHSKGADTAFQYLEGYKSSLSPANYVGLKAELNFYKKFDKEFDLTVGADYGDHTDFTGKLGNELYRFDVTTNASYKKLKDYEPLQRGRNAKYKIAVINDNGDLDELIDINFPFCEYCERGRIMDIALLLGENFNSKGESLWSNDQVLIGACSECDYEFEQQRITTPFLNDYSTEIKNAIEAEQNSIDYASSQHLKFKFDANNLVLNHSISVKPYLHREFDKSILAIGQCRYKTIKPDGEGYYMSEIMWRDKQPIFQPFIMDEYDFYYR